MNPLAAHPVPARTVETCQPQHRGGDGFPLKWADEMAPAKFTFALVCILLLIWRMVMDLRDWLAERRDD